MVGSDFLFCFILLLSVFQHFGRCDSVKLSYKKCTCEKINQHNRNKQYGIEVPLEIKVYSARNVRNKCREYLIHNEF